MDEARARARWTSRAARPRVGGVEIPPGVIGGFDHELAEEFFRAVANAARLTLHITLETGTNAHHIIEAAFKAFARALRAATRSTRRRRRPVDQGDADRERPVIGIVDYGMGNRRSVEKALERVGGGPRLTSDPEDLPRPTACVVPGVGAFPEAMRRLRATGLDELVARARGRGRAGHRPVPGHAAALRALLRARRRHRPGSAARRGRAPRRGGAEAAAHRLERRDLAAPVAAHRRSRREHGLLPRALLRPVPADEDIVLGTGEYGAPFVSFVEPRPVFGAQCHPEKSSTAGLALLRNFVRIATRTPVA